MKDNNFIENEEEQYWIEYIQVQGIMKITSQSRKLQEN